MKRSFYLLCILAILTATSCSERKFDNPFDPNFNKPVGMIYVPGGTFTMGKTKGSGYNHELPTHSVTLNSFYIGKYEVTQGEYKAIVGYNPASGYGVGNNYPVYNVNWYDAIKYCNLRSMNEGLTPVYSISGSTNPANWGSVPSSSNITWNAAVCNWNGNGYRLPTEAEWEYAARGATNSPDYLFSGSDNIDNVAWYDDNSDSEVHLVGCKDANRLGLYDMSGNVWEWCWDWYDASYYSSSPSNNPRGPANGLYRVLRGGCWYHGLSNCRVACRNDSDSVAGRYSNVGFRICRALK
jgi:formylglycine-generating enzyme required for sulfatase activity